MRLTRSSILRSAALLALACAAAACQSTTETRNENVGRPAANSAANTKLPEATPAATEKTSAGSMATPTEAYKTAYAARQNKDTAGLKKTFSKDALEFFSVVAEAEKKTVDEELKQLVEKPQAPSNETRNEKINGDRATLEYPDEKGNWKTMDFVKEGGEWKLTLPKAEGKGGGADGKTK